MRIREFSEAELRGGPEDELLGEAGCVHGREGGDVDEVDHEVAVGDGVDAVAEDPVEPELLRGRRRVERIRRARERACTEWRRRRALSRFRESCTIAPQRFDVRE